MHRIYAREISSYEPSLQFLEVNLEVADLGTVTVLSSVIQSISPKTPLLNSGSHTMACIEVSVPI